MHDLVLKGGRVIDPASDRDETSDIAFAAGQVSAIGPGLQAREELDCSGLIVTPGLIDLHTHVYWGGTSLGVDPVAYAGQAGVSTLVDTGSAGPGNFAGFREHVIRSCPIRILAYLHVSFAGIYGFGEEVMVGESGDIRLMAPLSAAEVARAHPKDIVGIKIRLGRHASGDQGMAPFEYALDVAEATGLPIMAHIDEPPPSYAALCARLRKGDVLTHAFRPFPNSPLGPGGAVREAVLEARARGVIFDIGHGMGSFGWDTAEGMLAAGFLPDVISSDVHALCIDGPAHDLPTTMSKFLHLGMSLPEIVRTVTAAPAAALGRRDLGGLALGGVGEATVLALEEGAARLTDTRGETRIADRQIRARALVIGGKVFPPAPH